MMAAGNFGLCLAFTLQYEGLFSNNPKDPGGATMKGITQAVYDAYRVANGLARLSVRFIADAEVKNIYRTQYWSRIGADMLPRGVDLLAFDIAVNSGVARANTWLDQTTGLTPLCRIAALDAKRRGFWKSLRIWPTFARGWTRREDACLALAKRMAQ